MKHFWKNNLVYLVIMALTLSILPLNGRAVFAEEAAGNEGLEVNFTNAEYTAASANETIGSALTAMGLVVSYNGTQLEEKDYTVTYQVYTNNENDACEVTDMDASIESLKPSRNFKLIVKATAFYKGQESISNYNYGTINVKYMTISFNGNDDAATGSMDPQKVMVGSTAQLNWSEYGKDDHVFVGWSKTKDGEFAYCDRDMITPDSEGILTLYAIWKKAGYYTLTLSGNGGLFNGTDEYYEKTLSVGEKYDLWLPVPESRGDGTYFAGYAKESNASKPDYVMDENLECTYTDWHERNAGDTVTLCAVWINPEAYETYKYTIRFNANGGTGSMEPQEFLLEEKKSLTKNTFKGNPGYIFKGWSDSANGEVKFIDGQEVNGLGSDGQEIELFAIWENVGTCTVSFNSNGGTGTMTDQEFIVGQAEALKANAFKRDGYTFLGWSDSAGGAVKYSDGQSIAPALPKGGSMTLYAVWDKNGNYTVSFNANGGTGIMASQTLSRNIAGKLSKNAFTREGYTFTGWSLSSNGAVNYTDEQTVKNLAAVDQTVVLYAVWKENSVIPPKDSKTRAIHVSSGAKVEKGGKEVCSAKTGEVITITYVSSSKDVKFLEWVITGASAADAKKEVTTFTMGESDVDVSFKTAVEESSSYEKLPDGADTITKVSKLAFKEKTLKLDVNSETENPATPVMTSGEAPAVSYYTENADIVAVTQTGKFIGRGQGTAKVYAQCGTKKASCTVTVTSHTADIAVLDPDNNDIGGEDLTINSGGMIQLRVDFKPVDTTDPRTVKWTSGNKKVATVNNGLITAKEFTDGDKNTVITVAVDRIGSDGKKVRLEKKINLTVKAVSVQKNTSKDNTHTLNLAGSMKMVTSADKNTGTLKVTLKPKKKGTDLSDMEISVESTDPEIVEAKIGEYTMDKKNRVNKVALTAKKCGTAYIIIRSGGQEDSSKINVKRCKVTVKSPAEKAEIRADSFGLLEKSKDKKTLTLRKGMSDTLTGVVTPEYSTDIKGMKWSVKGAGVSVKNGVVTAKKVTRANKPAKVTFKCGDASETIEVTVTK